MISFNLIEFDKIDSTSTFLKENYEKFDNFTLVFAKEQTNGHGRMKRKWHSNYGDAILFSLLIKDVKPFFPLKFLYKCLVSEY